MAEVLDTTALQWSKWPPKKTDAIDDKTTTDEDNSVTINVLGNDKNATGVYKIFPVKQISDVSLTDSALTDSVAAEDFTTSLSTKPYTITLESGATVTLENNKVTYNPNGQFDDLKEGQSEYDSFGYAAYGRYNTDRATVTVEIMGVTDDDEPPTGNRAPEANDDVAYVYNYPYPKPYPYPLPETEAQATLGETTAVEADLSDDLIYTTLAIGEEGDPSSVDIDVLWNDKDPDGDEMTIGTINGTDVAPEAEVTLDSGATVTISEDGKTLTYNPVALNYYSSDPLATEGDTAVTASGDTDALVIWEPIPFPYPKVDEFTYQAKDDEGALSNQATVTVYNSPIYYYDVGTDPVLEGTADVGDPSLLVV